MTDVNDPNAAPRGGEYEATPPPSYSMPPAPAQAPPLAQQPAYGQAYAPQAAEKWNVLSIVSFVTSLLGVSLVGIVLGHIGLSQIKRTGEQGRVFAIIGLVLGYLGILAGIVLLVIFIPLFFVAASHSVNSY
jgi:Domain of unknown function (DUF4190)